MRIAVHDYAGHAFPLQLARQLARRGHEVLHAWSSSLLTNPSAADDPSLTEGSFQSIALSLGRPVDKRNYFRLALEDEPAHARMLNEVLEEFQPEIVLSGNCSPQINHEVISFCRSSDARFVAWVQDLYGKATSRILPAKFPVVGHVLAAVIEASERKMLQKSDGMVLIAEEFRDHVPVTHKPVAVIQNWAPLEELPQHPKVNAWSTEHGLDQTINFVYSGTIGMKHNPELLVELAKSNLSNPDVRVVVISAGRGVEYLAAKKEEHGLSNLVLLPYQPFAQVPLALASSDALVAVLEPDAGIFSVPSKVLSYLCAGRAILLAVPPENLAARMVVESGAGVCVAPTEIDQFAAEGAGLVSNPETRRKMGIAGRKFAETTFDINKVADEFEAHFSEVLAKK